MSRPTQNSENAVKPYLPNTLTSTIIALVLLFSSSPFSFAVEPFVHDKDLTIQPITSGLNFATGMAFLGHDDILVLEKNKGTVQRIIDGQISGEPIIDVSVANQVERGMLGIAISKDTTNGTVYVFLFYTEAEEDGGQPIGNRLYRYELVEDKLVNPKLILDLPYLPGPAHNGGVVVIGPDENVYVVVGNLYTNIFNKGGESTQAQNIDDGEEPDGRGGILRVTQDGEVVDGEGILGEGHPLDKYYAYGIRNSFGIGFDPDTGKLWDTENGGFDEINLVEPGFNSGFNHISGSSSRSRNAEFDPDELADFGGNGIYRDPELDLGQHLAPTSVTFFNSEEFGEDYKNQLFVAGTKGPIFHFDLNDDRTDLVLGGPLEDKMVDEDTELASVTLAEGFGTDYRS